MEQKLGRTPAILATILTAAVACVLRGNQLLTAYDETGRVIVGAEKGPLTWLSVAVVIVSAVYSFYLRPRKKYHAIADRSPALLGLTLLAAAAMVLASVTMALELEQMCDLLLATGGLVAAICWVVVGLDRVRGRKSPAALFMVPALFYAVELSCNFRNWSLDPQILDYCFELLALICVMCATFHLGGFCFDKGGRRITVFFCFCGIFFSAASLGEGTLRSVSTSSSAILWLFSNLCPQLRPSRKRQDETGEP